MLLREVNHMLSVNRIKCVVLYFLSHPMNDYWSLPPWVSNKCKETSICAHTVPSPYKDLWCPSAILISVPNLSFKKVQLLLPPESLPYLLSSWAKYSQRVLPTSLILGIYHFGDLIVTQQIIHLFTLGSWLSLYLLELADCFIEWLLKRMLWFSVTKSHLPINILTHQWCFLLRATKVVYSL